MVTSGVRSHYPERATALNYFWKYDDIKMPLLTVIILGEFMRSTKDSIKKLKQEEAVKKT